MQVFITEAQFINSFRPMPNRLRPNASWDGALLETYGSEERLVKDVANIAQSRVWTLLETDGVLTISSGYHHVNRQGYFITEKPCPEGFEIETLPDPNRSISEKAKLALEILEDADFVSDVGNKYVMQIDAELYDSFCVATTD